MPELYNFQTRRILIVISDIWGNFNLYQSQASIWSLRSLNTFSTWNNLREWQNEKTENVSPFAALVNAICNMTRDQVNGVPAQATAWIFFLRVIPLLHDFHDKIMYDRININYSCTKVGVFWVIIRNLTEHVL